MKNFLAAIFSRGQSASTVDPLVSVGGVDPALIYQPLRLNSAGDLIVTGGSASSVETYMSAFTVVAGGAGHCVEIIGSGSQTVRVLEIYTEKPSVAATFTFLKQSAVDTGGTSAAQTLVPMSSANSAATATVKAYTAVPTPGTSIGNVFITALATTDGRDIQFEQVAGQPVTLIGTSQSLAINTSIAGTNLFVIWFTESDT